MRVTHKKHFKASFLVLHVTNKHLIYFKYIIRALHTQKIHLEKKTLMLHLTYIKKYCVLRHVHLIHNNREHFKTKILENLDIFEKR